MPTERHPLAAGEYSGPARVHGHGGEAIDGSGQVEWSDTGRLRICVVPDNSSFVFKNFFKRSDQQWQIHIATADGEFVAESAGIISQRMWIDAVRCKIEFSSHLAAFRATNAPEPRLWRAPLINFVMPLGLVSFPSRHPLRLYAAPEKPFAELEPAEAADAFNRN